MQKIGSWVLLAALAVGTVYFFWFWPGRAALAAFSPVRSGGQTLVLDAGHGGEDGGAVSLSGVPESGINLSIALKLDALLGLGAKNVVLKGIDHGDGKIINYVASAEKGAAEKVELVHDKLPYMIHGTGDAFASALCGAVMAGRGLAESARIAGEFVRHAMESTRNQPHFEERGVSFELDLGELTSLVK